MGLRLWFGVALVSCMVGCSRDSLDEIDIKAVPTCLTADDIAFVLAVRKKQVREAGHVLDKAIADCEPNAKRLEQRAILFAIDNKPADARRVMQQAIELAEKQGDTCQADLIRASLNVMQGGEKPTALPPSCAEKAKALDEKR